MMQSKWLLSGLAVAALLACCQSSRADDTKQAPNPMSQAAQAAQNLYNALTPWNALESVTWAMPAQSVQPQSVPCLPSCNEVPASVPQWPNNNANNLQDFIKVLECFERLAKLEKASDDSPENTQVQELIKILNETKSPAVLVATAMALAPLGDKAKVAVPAILRNAERLKVLDEVGNNTRKGELADALLDTILNIQSGLSPENDRGPGYGPGYGPAYVPGNTSRWNPGNRMAPPPPPLQGPVVPPYGYPPTTAPARPACPTAPGCTPICPTPLSCPPTDCGSTRGSPLGCPSAECPAPAPSDALPMPR
jgi:hypothetical protein